MPAAPNYALLKKNNMSKKNIIIIIATIILALGIGNIFVSSAMATTGNKLQELQSQQVELEKQTQELERAIATQQSLTRIETKAQELGLTQPSKVLHIITPESVALLR